MVLAKWESLLQHIQNVHDGFDGLYKKCQHPEDLTDRPWLDPSKCIGYLGEGGGGFHIDVKYIVGVQTSIYKRYHFLCQGNILKFD